MTPVDANREIPELCQNEKNKIPLTHRNFAGGQHVTIGIVNSRTGLNGLRSGATATQNIARQLAHEYVGSNRPPNTSQSDSLEREKDGQVVDNADVCITIITGEHSLLIRSSSFADDCDQY
jgi:hypothetical protein